MSEVEQESLVENGIGKSDSGDQHLASSDAEKLVAKGFKPKVAAQLAEHFQSGFIKVADVEDRTFDILRTIGDEQSVTLLKQFNQANLIGVSNPAAFLGTCVKSFRERQRMMGFDEAINQPLLQGPDKEKLQAILDTSGYSMEVTIGQRKYGGPPPDWDEGIQPPTGSEVYIGRLPVDVFEDVLIPLFETCGKIWDMRIMMNPMTGTNKGYAFVTYTTKEAAKAAADKYDNYEIQPNRRMKVNVSVPNTRLFIGNIPKNKSKEELTEEFKQHVDGVDYVIVYSTPDDLERKFNRGFCFLQFLDHKSASTAKRRFGSGKPRPFGREILVDWAEPEEEPDDDIMSKVKILYVKKLKTEVGEDEIRKAFEAYGGIDRVKRQKDYAFVHFTEREDALKAMDELQGKEFAGVPCEIVLAKPQMDKKKKMMVQADRARRQEPQMLHGGVAMEFEHYGFGPQRGRGGRGRFQRGGYGNAGYGGYGYGLEMYDMFDDVYGYGAGDWYGYHPAAEWYMFSGAGGGPMVPGGYAGPPLRNNAPRGYRGGGGMMGRGMMGGGPRPGFSNGVGGGGYYGGGYNPRGGNRGGRVFSNRGRGGNAFQDRKPSHDGDKAQNGEQSAVKQEP